ncbi:MULTISPECIES: helix-turn-helix transcriptional regulator [Streptomyces]|uniref:Helix-turn-helix transcriptional regulator n=1 Tax=Streptomyces griseiscabiei TaxID=2993540 RepID=A0ABU4LDU1_9ACTN|nr:MULTISPECIES: helix-turn-helix transcriptional regulator [Streptomyces]MBZ3908429.1 helix-turn-helix transcriptional regulator [Streptomyces griseiscabiei]MDX2913947.1 helix-turn-helix transcriptional regulator [Streptomyces griseiscabiei]
MTTTPPTTALTGPQRRVAAPLVYGHSPQAIAAQLQLSVDGVASQLRLVRKKMDRPGCSRPVLVHALLTARAVDPPACARPAPNFTELELTLLRALAEHSLNSHIGNAIEVRASDVRAEVGALVAKGGADNAHHLVGLAHTWGILGGGAPAPSEAAAGEAGR